MSFLERLDQRLRNMGAMLSRYGVDPVEFAKQDFCNQFTPAIRNCQYCRHGDECSSWLNRSGDKITEIPSFCPNKSRFERIRASLA